MLTGYKTYLAALGLFGKALYDASQGDYATAINELLGALAAVGLRHAISTTGK